MSCDVDWGSLLNLLAVFPPKLPTTSLLSLDTHAEEPMNRASLLLAAIAIAAGISAVHANLDPSWQDTEMTTR